MQKLNQVQYSVTSFNTKVVDLHNDLLSYLAVSPINSAYDTITHSSLFQMIKGGITQQVFVLYSPTDKHSVKRGLRQFAIYQELTKRYSEITRQHENNKIHARLAIENISTIINEQESLDKGLNRLQRIIKYEKPLYISLTWNSENRFGGGALTSVGLKPDGKLLLNQLRNFACALDISHASDTLSYDCIDYIEKKQSIPVIASHSNFRAISKVPRNIPDDIAKWIAKKKGIVGLNFYAPFIGNSYKKLFTHIEHALSLGLENTLAFGADFFSYQSVPRNWMKKVQVPFFNELYDASDYQNLFLDIQKEFGTHIAHKIYFENATRFIDQFF